MWNNCGIPSEARDYFVMPEYKDATVFSEFLSQSQTSCFHGGKGVYCLTAEVHRVGGWLEGRQ